MATYVTAPTVCSTCKRILGDYFEVTRHTVDGTATGSVRVCSLLCLINWAYAYGAHRATGAIKGVRDAVARLGASIRGPRR